MRTSSARTACWFVAEVDGQPGDQRIRWIDNDGVRWLQAGNNFNSVSVIATDLDRSQLGFAVANQSDLQAFFAKDQRIRWNGHRASLVRQLEVDKAVSTWQELAGRIVNIDFNKQRTRSDINGVGVANESAMKGLAREFIEGQSGGRTGTRGTGVHLRNRHVYSKCANSGDVKQFLRLRAGPCVDECPDIRIACGDDAVKGRIDLLERLQLLETPHVGGTRFGRGFRRAEIADGLVGFLLGYGPRTHQILPTGGSDFGNVQVGLRGIQLRLGLPQLLVHFGSFDLREQLTFLDMRANVEIPAPEITAGSCKERSVAECLRIARQDNFLCRGPFLRTNHGDSGNSSFLCSFHQPRFGCYSRTYAGVNQESECSEDAYRDQDCCLTSDSRTRAESI